MDNIYHNSLEDNTIEDKENLSFENFDKIKKEIWEIDITKEWIKKIYQWKEKVFKNDKSFTKNIWKIDVNYLFFSTKTPKPINGCHQHALVLKAVLEKYGFQVKMIETINKDRKYNKKIFSGHVLLKICIEWKREILDTTTENCFFLNQDQKTKIIDNQRYPFAEGSNLRDMWIVDSKSLYNKMKEAYAEFKKQKRMNKYQKIKDIIIDILNQK